MGVDSAYRAFGLLYGLMEAVQSTCGLIQEKHGRLADLSHMLRKGTW